MEFILHPLPDIDPIYPHLDQLSKHTEIFFRDIFCYVLERNRLLRFYVEAFTTILISAYLKSVFLDEWKREKLLLLKFVKILIIVFFWKGVIVNKVIMFVKSIGVAGVN